MAFNYNNIPDELKAYPQFVCWRYVERNGKKTKQPFNPLNGYAASVTNPADWCSFEDAVDASSKYDGIGFVFTNSDPFTGIDIDHTDNPGMAEVINRISSEFPSYSERSPSGNGYHVITRGKVLNGRRRDGVEVYSTERYFTMTGDVVNDVPIVDCQSKLDILFDEMAPRNKGSAGSQADEPETLTDEAVVALILATPKLAKLYQGDTSDYEGKSASEPDQALCNALAARSRNRAQVERIWLASPLGARDRTQTDPRYRRITIETAFDCPSPSVGDFRHVTVNGKLLFEPTPLAPAAIVDAADLEAMRATPRSDMWGGNAPVGQVTLFDAPGGVGKSLFGQQQATCVALGLPFLGHPTMPGVALYVTCEDDISELHRRQHDICKAMGVSFVKQRQRLALVSLTGEIGNELASFDQQGRMTVGIRLKWLLDTIQAIGAKFVVLDNVAHLFAGNENIRNQVAAFLGLLNKVAHDTGAAVILIAHTNKAGDQSGSTAWSNQVRTRLTLQIPQDSKGFISDFNARVLIRAKSNYGRTGKSIKFRWHNGAFSFGSDLNTDISEIEQFNAITVSDDNLFLLCLAERTRQHRAVSERLSPTYAPTVFAQMAESDGIGKRRLELAMERLFRLNAIERAVLWRDTDKARDIAGLRIAAQHPQTVPPNAPRTLFPERPPNGPQTGPERPPNASPANLYIDKGGAIEAPHPIAEEGGLP